MSYAIFYNHEDLSAIAANVNATLANSYDQFLTNQQKTTVKQTFQKAWTNGLSGWATAPLAGALDPQGGDFDALIIVVSGTGGQAPTKADLIAAMRIIGANVPNAAYMNTIADDLVGTCIEPWPPA